MPPIVEVSSITFRGAGPLSGVSTDVTLSITNPNVGTLEATSFTYRAVKKSDRTLLTEGTGKPFIAPGGKKTTEVVVPVNFGMAGIGAAGKSLLFRGQTTILVSGNIVFDAPYSREGKVVVPFNGEETIIIE